MSESKCKHPLKSTDGHCDRPARLPDGRCKYHSELSDEEWKPNYKHGLYLDRGGYYENLPDEEQDWIDAVTFSILEDSYYDAENLAMLEKCREVAIDMHKKRRADEYIHKKGMAQTQDVGFHEDYGPIQQEEENVLHITADRLSRESRMTLKDLGVMDKDKDNAEDVGESVIEALSKEVEED